MIKNVTWNQKKCTKEKYDATKFCIIANVIVLLRRYWMASVFFENFHEQIVQYLCLSKSEFTRKGRIRRDGAHILNIEM